MNNKKELQEFKKFQAFQAIILSAGYSKRMKKFKPLLPLGETTVIENTINNFKKAGINNIVVILGYKSELLQDYLEKINIKFIINKDYSKGMFSSVKIAVENLNKETKAFFITPVDIPLVKKSTIDNMIKAYNENKASVICPSYNEKTGHPILMSAELRNTILSYENPEQGLGTVIKNLQYSEGKNQGKNKGTVIKNPQYSIMNLQVCDRGILYDLDDEQGYEKVKNYYKTMDIPNKEDIETIFKLENTDKKIIKHGEKVSFVASVIGEKLNQKGYNLDIELIKSASYLHDIAKGNHNHEKIGAEIIANYGYIKLADIIKNHMDSNLGKRINEENIVYIADKLVKEDKIIKIEDRFYQSIKRYSNEKHIINNILLRYSKAKILQRKIEEEIEEELGDIFG
ncbi:MAG: DVU_1551 family NTP transferase [Clostridiaceae bacterium]